MLDTNLITYKIQILFFLRILTPLIVQYIYLGVFKEFAHPLNFINYFTRAIVNYNYILENQRNNIIICIWMNCMSNTKFTSLKVVSYIIDKLQYLEEIYMLERL